MQAKLRAEEAKRVALEAEKKAAKEAAEREAAEASKRIAGGVPPLEGDSSEAVNAPPKGSGSKKPQLAGLNFSKLCFFFFFLFCLQGHCIEHSTLAKSRSKILIEKVGKYQSPVLKVIQNCAFGLFDLPSISSLWLLLFVLLCGCYHLFFFVLSICPYLIFPWNQVLWSFFSSGNWIRHPGKIHQHFVSLSEVSSGQLVSGNLLRSAENALKLEEQRQQKLKELDEVNKSLKSCSNEVFSLVCLEYFI